MSAIVKLIGALSICVFTIDITAVNAIASDVITVATIEICSVLSPGYNGVFGDEIIKILNLLDSMEP